MENKTQGPSCARASVESFASELTHLRALHADLRERRAKVSRGERWLLDQIARHTDQCRALAERNPRLTELWREAEAELAAAFLPTPPPLEPSSSPRLAR